MTKAAASGRSCSSIGDLRSAESEEQEEECANELAHHGDEVIANFVREEAYAWQSKFFLRRVGVRTGHAREGDEVRAGSVDVHDGDARTLERDL